MSEVRIGSQTEQLELIYNTAPTGIALLNDKLEFITCNSALLQLLGFTFEELCSKTLTVLCDPLHRENVCTLVNAAETQDARYLQNEIQMVHKDGSAIWVEITLQYISPELQKPGSYVIIVQNIQERKEMQIELNELRRRLTESHELERKNLAQELHDGPMQDLHSILFQLAAMEEDLPDSVKKQVQVITRTVENINRDLRSISYDLRQPALSQFGLAKTIRSHADEFKVKHPDLNINLELVEDGRLISEEVRLGLFRIYQQALVNVIRHAKATEATVRLNLDGDAATLEIIDNGVGFIVPSRWLSLVRSGHYGLAGAIERVNAFRGEFCVDSAPGKGTKIIVRIPDYMEIENATH